MTTSKLMHIDSKTYKCAHCSKHFIVTRANQWVGPTLTLVYPTKEGHPYTPCEAIRGNGVQYQQHPCCNDCHIPTSYNPDNEVSY